MKYTRAHCRIPHRARWFKILTRNMSSENDNCLIKHHQNMVHSFFHVFWRWYWHQKKINDVGGFCLYCKTTHLDFPVLKITDLDMNLMMGFDLLIVNNNLITRFIVFCLFISRLKLRLSWLLFGGNISIVLDKKWHGVKRSRDFK